MQNLPWKKIAIGVVAVGIIAFGIFYFTESKVKKRQTILSILPLVNT